MSRIFMSPEMDDVAFYRNIKSTILLYDEIIIWQPTEERLEKAGMHPDEFVKLIDPINVDGEHYFPIRPAGRELFFDYDYRISKEKDEFRRQVTPAFVRAIDDRKLVSLYARRGDAIANANRILDEPATAETWREKAKHIFQSMNIDKKPDVLERMNRNAESRGIDIYRANFQEFLMDSYAIRDLSLQYGFNDVKLLADQSHWEAYSIVDDEDHLGDYKDNYTTNVIDSRNVDKIASNPQVKEFFDIFLNSQDAPIKEILHFKKRHRKLIREYIFSRENSIKTGSLLRDSFLYREGIYRHVKSTADQFLNLSAQLVKPLDGGLHLSGGSEILSAISKMVQDLQQSPIFNNGFLLMDMFPVNLRRYLVNSRINIAKIFFTSSSALTRENAEEIKYFPLFIDTVGFARDFGLLHKNLEISKLSDDQELK